MTPDQPIFVVGNGDQEFRDIFAKLEPGQIVVDLIRLTNKTSNGEDYDGICW